LRHARVGPAAAGVRGWRLGAGDPGPADGAARLGVQRDSHAVAGPAAAGGSGGNVRVDGRILSGMVVAVYPRLGELLQERKLTVAELQRQIETRYALPVDRKTLYRLTYHEPVRRAELDVAA